MKVIATNIKDVLIIEPDVFGDNRGWFCESYNKQKYFEAGIKVDFVQDNHSYSAKKGTLRGIHFQNNPKAQAKLIRCAKGIALDVAVDLRKKSKTFKQWVAVELSAENKKQLFVPKGFGHGFVTLTPNVEFLYKVDEYYSTDHDRSIRFDDPELNIVWDTKDPIISDKDRNAPLLKNSDINF